MSDTGVMWGLFTRISKDKLQKEPRKLYVGFH
jgi:hypothetical protein